MTRLRAEDKARVIKEDKSIHASLPRGTKSHHLVEALQIALYLRLKALGVTLRLCGATATNFVWIRLFSTKERDWTLKKLAKFIFTSDGTVMCPEIVRYGQPKATPKAATNQIPRSVTPSTEILIALAGHIKNDKTLPGFRVYELLKL